jgi:hypothetical protein
LIDLVLQKNNLDLWILPMNLKLLHLESFIYSRVGFFWGSVMWKILLISVTCQFNYVWIWPPKLFVSLVGQVLINFSTCQFNLVWLNLSTETICMLILELGYSSVSALGCSTEIKLHGFVPPFTVS